MARKTEQRISYTSEIDKATKILRSLEAESIRPLEWKGRAIDHCKELISMLVNAPKINEPEEETNTGPA